MAEKQVIWDSLVFGSRKRTSSNVPTNSKNSTSLSPPPPQAKPGHVPAPSGQNDVEIPHPIIKHNFDFETIKMT